MTTSKRLREMQSGQLTLLPEDSPASRSVSPGSDEARRMTVTSGRKWLGLLANAGPAGCLVRTLLESSAWRSTIVSLTWKASVTKRGRLFFRLAASAPGTGESGSGLWPTVTANDAKNNGSPSQMERNPIALNTLVHLIPTPRAEGFDAGAHRGKPDSLHSFVKMFPTPRVCSGLRSSGSNRSEIYDAMDRNGLLPTPRSSPNENRQTKPTPSQLAGTHGKSLAAEIGGALNPAFVEWLMGYPDGWTDLER